MHTVKKLSLKLISILIYILVPTLLLLNVLESAIFEDKVISNTLGETGLYEQTSENLINQLSITKETIISDNSNDQVNEKAEKYVSTINMIIEQSITPSWVESKIEEYEKSLLLAIKENKEVDTSINISDLKSSILTSFDASFSEEEKNNQFHNKVRNTLADLPEEINANEAGINMTNTIKPVQNYYSDYKQKGFWVSLAVIILFIIAAIIAFTLGTVYRWIGSTITSIGVSIFFSFVVLKYIPSILNKLDLQLITSESIANDQLNNAFSYITSTLANKLLPYGIGVLVIGLAILAISYAPKFSPKIMSDNEAA